MTAAMVPIRTPERVRARLTPRQAQIVDMLIDGATVKSVARRMDITTQVAYRHISLAMGRVGARSTHHLAALIVPIANLAVPVNIVPTERQRQTLVLLSSGLGAGEIAGTYRVGTQTVSVWIAEARGLLGARTTTQAVAMAVAGGLIARPS